MPRLRGVPYLEPGTRVYREDIEAWEQQTGVRVEPGDVLLIRTGRWARRNALNEETGTAGMDASFLPFLAERDVALPVRIPNGTGSPINPIAMFYP